MKRLPTLFAAAAAVVVLSHCAENPADNVTRAEVTDSTAEEVTLSTASASTTDPAAPATVYVFTEDSTIGFVGSKVTGSHEGGFKVFTGGFTVAGDDLATAEHKVIIDMNSTWSDNEKLTGHLLSPDFFDAEQFPEATFVAKSAKKLEGENQYQVTGDFTFHGVTKTISFPAEVVRTDDAVTMNAEFAINRFDFGVKYPGKADDLIREEVVIKLDLKAMPQAG